MSLPSDRAYLKYPMYQISTQSGKQEKTAIKRKNLFFVKHTYIINRFVRICRFNNSQNYASKFLHMCHLRHKSKAHLSVDCLLAAPSMCCARTKKFRDDNFAAKTAQLCYLFIIYRGSNLTKPIMGEGRGAKNRKNTYRYFCTASC